MARKPMVTRTIETTKVTVLCLNIETAEPFNKTVTVARTHKDENKLLKLVKEIAETSTEKVVHIVDKEVISTLYGMTEDKFIANAEILPPRDAKEEAEESEVNFQ